MKWQEELQEICQRQPLKPKWGYLYSEKGHLLRAATEFEYKESYRESFLFGSPGYFHVSFSDAYGWWYTERCYVIGGPSQYPNEY